MEMAETAGTEPQAAEAAPDADQEDDEETRRIRHETAEAERKAGKKSSRPKGRRNRRIWTGLPI